MEFTKDEINRFASLARTSDKARRFLSSDGGHIKAADIVLKDNNSEDVYETRIIVSYEHETCYNIIYFKDEGRTVFSDDDSRFIKSMLKKRLCGLHLIYTTDVRSAYEEDDISSRDIKIVDDSFMYTDGFDICISLLGNLHDITYDNADFTDDVWDVLYSKRDIMLQLLKYYMHYRDDLKCFSPKIQKRIQTYYDSLSDSDKLLLEIGCD